jgi:hypothetical protein
MTGILKIMKIKLTAIFNSAPEDTAQRTTFKSPYFSEYFPWKCTLWSFFFFCFVFSCLIFSISSSISSAAVAKFYFLNSFSHFLYVVANSYFSKSLLALYLYVILSHPVNPTSYLSIAFLR